MKTKWILISFLAIGTAVAFFLFGIWYLVNAIVSLIALDIQSSFSNLIVAFICIFCFVVVSKSLKVCNDRLSS